jgi:hypothetical protein
MARHSALRRRYGRSGDGHRYAWITYMTETLKRGGYAATKADVRRLLAAGYGPEEIAYRVRTGQVESQLGIRRAL